MKKEQMIRKRIAAVSGLCRKRKTFTLIELLVVIAIIAILAGMLLPALNSAREKGRMIKCLGQQKQIGVMVLNYIQDFKEYLPIGNILYPGDGEAYTFQVQLTELQCPGEDCVEQGKTESVPVDLSEPESDLGRQKSRCSQFSGQLCRERHHCRDGRAYQ